MISRSLRNWTDVFRNRLCLFVLSAVFLPAAVAEAQRALPDLSLEDLMQIDSGRVFGASLRTQPATEAPSSVSFVTKEEIARYGYRSLAEILNGVRGLYVTNDRNFSYLGARGFGMPGDYNSRVLLLINGHRVNDNVFGQAEIGPEFGLDPAMVERVEIIRGPGSALYGDSAFFAVVNVITRNGASVGPPSATVEAGTLGRWLVRSSAGHHAAHGVDVAASATYEGSRGNKRLYFPAFDSSTTNNGIAEGLDGERLGEFYTQLTAKRFTFTGAFGTRRRDVPTASFGTVFNEQTSREQTTDRHALADVEYSRPVLGTGHLAVRGSFDRFSYDGSYPFAGDAGGVPVIVGKNAVIGSRWSASGRITHGLPGRQVMTVGAEFIDNITQHQEIRYVDPPVTLFSLDPSSTQHAVYADDQLKVNGWLIFNGGIRYDRYENFSATTPRAGVIVTPSPAQAFKYLYGRAFRAPNQYEQNAFYFGDAVQQLRPERIDTHELVWERYTNDWLRTSVSTYWYHADRLITVVPDEATLLGATYINEAQVRAKGLELEAQMRLPRGLEAVTSYTLQRAQDLERVDLPSSPKQMAKFRMSTPMSIKRSSMAVEVLVLGRRKTLGGNTLDPAITANLTCRFPLGQSLDLTGSVRNLFNETYFDAASGAHREDAIQQTGRTVRVGVTMKLGSPRP